MVTFSVSLYASLWLESAMIQPVIDCSHGLIRDELPMASQDSGHEEAVAGAAMQDW